MFVIITSACPTCSGTSSSMITESTNVSHCNSHRHRDLYLKDLEEFPDGEANLKDEEKVTFRKNLLARQLSGDPEKLNPDIALNEQTKAMVYNPKHEIDRSNFSYGQMLGSGNFGCVYEGKTSLLEIKSDNKISF